MLYVITGTNTDVGKTIATAALVARCQSQGRKVHVVKPAQTGEPAGQGDLVTIARLTGIPPTQLTEFIRYPEPLAPYRAALRAELPLLDLHDTAARVRALDGPDTVVLVEGAGGLLVQLGPWTIADLARELHAPVIVVTHTELGCLNAAQLTVEAVRHRGVECAGLIGGSVPAEPDLATVCNIDDLPAVTGVPVLGWIPAGAGELDREDFCRDAPGWVQLPAEAAATPAPPWQ